MILVLVKIPSNLHGASLLKAHSWVKSHVARSNPGGSPDYKLSDASGNPMTLSDVVRNPNTDVIIEVATIEGARRNPASSLAPIPDIEFDYPTKPRSGDHLKALLPSDLDPALVTRIVAEQGLIRGLHTLNRLTVEDAEVKPVTPTTAALMQLNQVRMNPGRTPFTKRTPEIYGSEKALASWLGDEYGAESIEAHSSRVNNAKIAAKYGLNKHDIQKFAKEVLSDYLLAASANRGLIRSLIRNNPSLRGNREVIAKLTQVFPCHPQPFYDGVQRVFVAHPAFIYPAYADTIITQRGFSKALIDFVSAYPQSLSVTGKLKRGHTKMSKYIGVASSSGGFKNLYKQFQNFIFRVDADDSADVIDAEYGTQGYWRTITDRLSQSPEVAVKKANFRPLQYFTDLGGFYPSPPPKWPKHIVYAIMDAFLENMPYLLQSDGEAHMDPITLSTMTEAQFEIKDLDLSALGIEAKDVKLEDLRPILEGGYSEEKIKKIIAKGSTDDLKKFIEKAGKSKTAQLKLVQKAIKEAVISQIERDAAAAIDKKSRVVYDTEGTKSVLEMAYDVAEISKSKYNQSLIGDDFKFVMAMLHVSIHALNESTDPGDFTAENFAKYLSGTLGAKRGEELNRLREKLAESEIEGDDEAMQFRTILMAQLMLIRNDIEARLPTMDEDARRREIDILQRQRAAISRDARMDIRFRAGIMDYMQETIDMVGA